jgi:septal ring-binding cell division protein DamX
MDKRQTIITSVTVAAIFILAEQVYQLVRHDISHASESKANTVAMIVPKIDMPAPTPAPTYQPQLPASVVANQQQLITHQQQYIQLVNQYELAKMQRQLLEEEVAIAAARQRIAEINQKTQQITGQQTASDDVAATTSFAEPAPERHSENLPAYQLAYLDRQGDNYTATVVDRGHYQEITAGLQLADGSQVKQIDTQGVLFQTADKKAFRLTFSGLVPVEENTVIAPDNVVANKEVTAPISAPAPVEKNIVSAQVNMIKQPVSEKPPALPVIHQAPEKPRIVHHISIKKMKPTKYTVVAAKQLKKYPSAIKHKTSIVSHKNKIKKIVKVAKLSTTKSKKIKLGHLSVAQTNLFDPSTSLKISPMPSAAIKVAVAETPAIKYHKKTNRIQAYTLDEILLLELPPTSYTIELKGAYDKHDLVVFAQQNALGENAIYYSMPREHKIWHVLLYSYFNTKMEAQEAFAKLPVQILAINPQIQPVSDIQQSIKIAKQ